MRRRFLLSRSGIFVPAPTAITMASRVAEVRAHTSFGTYATSTSNANAPSGLEIMTRPTGSGGAFTEYGSLTDLNNAANGGSNRSVRLAPGTYTGQIYIYASVSNIRVDVTGCTINPSDGNQPTLIVRAPANRIEVFSTDRSAALNGCFQVNPYSGGYPENIWFTNLLFAGTRTLNDGAGANGNDGGIGSARGFYIQGCRIFASGGGMTAGGGSVNLIVFNSEIVCPKFTGGGDESPWRMNGVDHALVADCRLETKYGVTGSGTLKRCLRSHASFSDGGLPGGRNYVVSTRVVGGGAMGQYPGAYSDNAQSQYWGWQDVELYSGDLTESGISFPYENTGGVWGGSFIDDVMNERVDAFNVTAYTNDRTAGTAISWSEAGGEPPGTRTNCVYAADATEPAWDYIGEPEDMLV